MDIAVDVRIRIAVRQRRVTLECLTWISLRRVALLTLERLALIPLQRVALISLDVELALRALLRPLQVAV